jgi:hypothetical protein
MPINCIINLNMTRYGIRSAGWRRAAQARVVHQVTYAKVSLHTVPALCSCDSTNWFPFGFLAAFNFTAQLLKYCFAQTAQNVTGTAEVSQTHERAGFTRRGDVDQFLLDSASELRPLRTSSPCHVDPPSLSLRKSSFDTSE